MPEPDLQIVDADKIPVLSKIEAVPLEDPMIVYNTGIRMKQCCELYKGVGLSAVQVGIPWKFFLTHLKNKTRYFANCEYEPIESQGRASSVEQCLSLKNGDGYQQFYVTRWKSVRIIGQELVIDESIGKPVFINVDSIVTGFQAVVLQHEIDHHRGVLISEIGKEVYLRTN
jgi:peptide deformylase